MSTKTFSFGGLALTFIDYNNKLIIPAKLVGQALGYSKNGAKVIDMLTSNPLNKVFKKGTHYIKLSGQELADVMGSAGAESLGPSRTFFTIQGLERFLLHSRRPEAVNFRNELEEAHISESKQMDLPFNGGSKKVDHDKMERLADKLKEVGEITKEEYASILRAILNSTVSGKPINLDLTSLRSSGQKLLGYKPLPQTLKHGVRPPSLHGGWKTASEIGEPLNLTSDQVKTVITKINKEHYKDELLANNIAREKVQKLGDIRNLPANQDGYLYVHNNDLSCVAVYSENEDGQAVWRNYWSPKMAETITEDCRVKYDLVNVVTTPDQFREKLSELVAPATDVVQQNGATTAEA